MHKGQRQIERLAEATLKLRQKREKRMQMFKDIREYWVIINDNKGKLTEEELFLTESELDILESNIKRAREEKDGVTV